MGLECIICGDNGGTFMRLWFSGPRIFGIRPGISVSVDELLGRRRARNNIPAALSESSFVYVIKDESGRVKIGSSSDPSRRLKELQTGHPEKLTLEFIGAATIDGAVIERMAHNLLHNYRINNEWFSISTAYAISAIYGIAAKQDAKIKQVSETEAQQIMRIITGLETMTDNGRRRNKNLMFILALAVLILLMLILIAPAHARGHKLHHIPPDISSSDISYPTAGDCMAAISVAERNGNVWQEENFTMDDCTKVAGKMIDNGYKMMCEGGVQSACDMNKD